MRESRNLDGVKYASGRVWSSSIRGKLQFLECADLSALWVGCDRSPPSLPQFVADRRVKPRKTKALTGQRTPKYRYWFSLS